MNRRFFTTFVIVIVSVSLVMGCSPAAPTESIRVRLATRTPLSAPPTQAITTIPTQTPTAVPTEAAAATAAPPATATLEAGRTATPADPQATPTAAASSATAANNPVIVAVDEANPPFMYADANGKAAGLYPALLQAIFQQMGTAVQVKTYPWKRALTLGQNGEAGIGGIYKNDQRLQIFDYSDPLFTEKILVYVPKGKSFKFDSVKDLAGKSVGVLAGWSYGDAFDQAKAKGTFTTQEVASDADNLNKLVMERLDCIVAIEASAQQIIQDKGYGAKVEALPTPLAMNDTYLVFAKTVQQGQRLKAFNAALAALRQDGEYAALTSGYAASVSAVTTPTATPGTVTIRLATGEWPPYSSEKSSDDSITTKIVAEAFAQEGVTVQYGYFPWARAFELAQKGEWDGTLLWAHKPEWTADFYFSDQPVAQFTWVWWHRRDKPFDWTTVDALKGLTIGGTPGYKYVDQLTALAKTGQVKFDVSAPDDETNYRKLLAGRTDIFVMDATAGCYILKSEFKPEEQQALTYHAKAFYVDNSYLLLAKKVTGNDARLALFNDGLQKLQDSGRLAELSKLPGGSCQ